MPLKFYLGVAMTILWAGVISAQPRPSFTGTWIQEAAGTQSQGTSLKITDEPALLTIETITDGAKETLTFSWIGEPEAVALAAPPPASAEKSKGPDTGGPTSVQETTAHWHDDHLETYIVRLVNGKTVTQTIQYTLNNDRTRLRVHRVLQVQHGYESSSGSTGAKEEFYVRH